jgi:CheY-like chemotaxis protein/anti-sigma regulatory factor (Ser/Thr protein kinase)
MARLLIVDDDPVDRELAGRCLEGIADLDLLEAGDGQEAIETCLRESPDLVLTDLRMPILDGLGLVREVRQRLPLVPVILMTARGSEQVAAAALAAGAVSYVPKADLAELLAETVEQALAVATARHERVEVLRYFKSSQSWFELANDPALISPLVAFLQDDLERIGFADEQVRSQIGTALLEAISNAMIHGNLGVSSDLRKEGTEPYHRLIAERRRQEPWSRRLVYCTAEQSVKAVRYVIRDEGAGFDRSSLPDPTSTECMLEVQGRGLFLMCAFMDAVEYNEAGNEVRLTKLA